MRIRFLCFVFEKNEGRNSAEKIGATCAHTMDEECSSIQEEADIIEILVFGRTFRGKSKRAEPPTSMHIPRPGPPHGGAASNASALQVPCVPLQVLLRARLI